MNRYTNIKVRVSEGQKDKIKRAVEVGMGVNIRLSHGDLSGEHILALTKAQINKMAKAYRGGTGITIKLSKSQLHHNMKVEVSKLMGSGLYIKRGGRCYKMVPFGTG